MSMGQNMAEGVKDIGRLEYWSDGLMEFWNKGIMEKGAPLRFNAFEEEV